VMKTKSAAPATGRVLGTDGPGPEERLALARLADTRGLARTRVTSHSDEIQVVTYDGEYIGRIRLAAAHARQQRWIAIPVGRQTTLGSYTSARAAANALGQATGRVIAPKG
jgi:hypothetical protein